jgi:hypothetical protein
MVIVEPAATVRPGRPVEMFDCTLKIDGLNLQRTAE